MIRLGRAAVLALLALAPLASCSSLAEEGESCDRANGNADCEDGLICRSALDVAATRSVCCPRPPEKPSSAECEPELAHAVPDPSIDASYGAGGTGTGGTAGGAGSGGSAGFAGAASDAAADGNAGAGGSAGQAGGAGMAGGSGAGGKPNKPDGGKPDGG